VIDRRYDLIERQLDLAGKDATENAQRVFLAEQAGAPALARQAVLGVTQYTACDQKDRFRYQI